MDKTITGILPWAMVLAVGGAASWWLLSREMAAGRWLLAALLLGHGLVHLLFAVPAQASTGGGPEWPFDMARSWTASRAGVDPDMVRIPGLALVAIVVVGFATVALSTVGIVVPSEWWPATAAISAVASGVLLALFFQPQLVLGLGIDAGLLLVVASRAWTP